jgi:hypothetical protein
MWNFDEALRLLLTTDWMKEYYTGKIAGFFVEGGKPYFWITQEQYARYAMWGTVTGWNGEGYYSVTSSSSPPLTYTFSLKDKNPRYEESSLYPDMDVPGWFAKTNTYKDSLIAINGKQTQTDLTWPLLLFANLIDKNTSGLNTTLEEITNAIFGESFAVAETRIGQLTEAQGVYLSQELIEAFTLGEIFEGNEIWIGRAELKALIAALRILKASLEWVSAYDWDTDLAFLQADWEDAAAMASAMDRANISKFPLRSNFLKDRNNGKMALAKADYIKSIDDLIEAYDSFGANGDLPPAARDTLNTYKSLKDGLTKLKAAINTGTVFWFAEPPTGAAWNITQANAAFGVDMGKLFTPGYLGADKILAVEANRPNTPQLAGHSYSGSSPQGQGLIGSAADCDKYTKIGFGLKTEPFKALAPKLLDDLDSVEYVYILPSAMGKKLYTLYHR